MKEEFLIKYMLSMAIVLTAALIFSPLIWFIFALIYNDPYFLFGLFEVLFEPLFVYIFFEEIDFWREL